MSWHTGSALKVEPIDSHEFRCLMRNVPGQVSIVAAGAPGHRRGLTASAACSLTDVPPTVIVCINRAAAAHDLIIDTGAFSINTLAANQEAIAHAFSGVAGISGEQRFGTGDWSVGTTGVPVLASAVCRLECRLTEFREASSHTIFIGHVVAGSASSEATPLLYLRGSYVGLEPEDRYTEKSGASCQRELPAGGLGVAGGERAVIIDREVASTGAATPTAREPANGCGRMESRRPFKVAYLVNQYPAVSHSFIRREILAVERRGVAVERIAIRGWDTMVVDADDIAERARVRYALEGGIGPLLRSSLRCFLAAPLQFGNALLEALRLSHRAERPLPYHLMYLGEACRILEWVRAAGVDHIHAHFGTNSAEVALLVRALGGPAFSFTVHGPDEFDKAYALHLDKKIAAANFVVAVNSYCRAQLFRRAAISDWSKIKIVHCGLEENSRAVGSERLPTKGRFVCVGRLCEQKGQLVLLEAFARLQSRLGGCRLVLAGDGEMRREIEARISALNLGGRVTITGWLSSTEVRDEILAAEALILPSFQESLPVVIMEAMALRRPVITTYVAGIPELVTPGETGWLVPAASIEPLVASMEACMNTPAEDLRRMGETAFRRVTERHDVDVEAAKLVALFCTNPVADEIDEWQS